MTNAHVAGTAPIGVDVTAGKDYWWCTCGQSKNQPFCDGAHKAEGKFSPQQWTATEDKKVFFCTCKQTANAPLCDGAHKKL